MCSGQAVKECTVVDLHCHLDQIWSHVRDTSGIPSREFLEMFSLGGKTCLECGWHHPWHGVLALIKRKQESKPDTSIYLSSGSPGCEQAASSSGFPPPSVMTHNKPTFLYCFRYLVTHYLHDNWNGFFYRLTVSLLGFSWL